MKNCVVCDIVFLARRYNQKTCASDRCKRAHKANLDSKVFVIEFE